MLRNSDLLLWSQVSPISIHIKRPQRGKCIFKNTVDYSHYSLLICLHIKLFWIKTNIPEAKICRLIGMISLKNIKKCRSGNHLPFAFWSMMGPDISRLVFNLLSISLRSLANLKKGKKPTNSREMAVLSFPQNGQGYSSIVPMPTRLFGVSSNKDTNPIMRAPSSWPHLITSP